MAGLQPAPSYMNKNQLQDGVNIKFNDQCAGKSDCTVRKIIYRQFFLRYNRTLNLRPLAYYASFDAVSNL